MSDGETKETGLAALLDGISSLSEAEIETEIKATETRLKRLRALRTAVKTADKKAAKRDKRGAASK